MRTPLCSAISPGLVSSALPPRSAARWTMIDHGLIAGEVRLRRQHVHALRAGDARHQLHGEQRDAGLGQRVEPYGIGKRIEHADQSRALLHRLGDGKRGTPHGEHHIGAGDSIRVALGDLRAGLFVILIGEMGPQAGAQIAKSDADAVSGADVVFTVRRPPLAIAKAMKKGAALVGMLDPFSDAVGLDALAKTGVSLFAMELMPRITRAQSMDVLSSQSNLAGYKAV